MKEIMKPEGIKKFTAMIHELDQEMAKIMEVQAKKEEHKEEIVDFMQQLKSEMRVEDKKRRKQYLLTLRHMREEKKQKKEEKDKEKLSLLDRLEAKERALQEAI